VGEVPSVGDALRALRRLLPVLLDMQQRAVTEVGRTLYCSAAWRSAERPGGKPPCGRLY
jgi:hypothetical protein